MRERRILAAQPGGGARKRGQDAKRPSRRALRCEFYAKVFSGHAQQREDLVLLFQSVPGETTAVKVAGNSSVCVPSSFRPGSATYWFREWQEDLNRLQWRGRWLHFKTLAHYIQELGCISIMQSLSPVARRKVKQLAELCESACNVVEVEAAFMSGVHRLFDLLKAPR